MPEVSTHAIMMAIQAVHAEIIRIVGDQPVAKLDPDDQELLLSYSRAAEEFKAAYIEARKTQTNLPPYDVLIGASS